MLVRTYSSRRTMLLAAALVVTLVVFIWASPAWASTITVTTAADEQNTNDQCSLREAIINANQNDQSGSADCAAGVGEDTINFQH
jgi:CSLREA domain-containing protein